MRPALRGASPWGCIRLVLLVTGAALRCAAAPLVRMDKVDPLHPSTGGDDFYQVQDTDTYCKKCPAGTYVAEHCKGQSNSSKCLPCKEGEYTEYPNDFPKCLGCRTCREDQVLLRPCRATSDAQCACRNGTFCSPDHPCEMCQKCRPRCAKGEVELAPCTPDSDRRCGPPTDTLSSFSTAWIVAIVVSSLVVILVVVIVGYRRCHSSGDKRELSRKSCSAVDYLVQLLTRYRSRDVGRGDNNFNELLDRHSVTPPGPEVNVPGASYPTVKPRRTLVPVQGREPSFLLRRSFDIFAQEVPCKDWKRFGRALDLLENDITLAEMNDRYSLEPFFQMLNTWQNRQGMNASVNTLLETLHQINLGGIAEDISSKLVQQGYFEYEAD